MMTCACPAGATLDLAAGGWLAARHTKQQATREAGGEGGVMRCVVLCVVVCPGSRPLSLDPAPVHNEMSCRPVHHARDTRDISDLAPGGPPHICSYLLLPRIPFQLCLSLDPP